ncbi:hypothetical protein T11_2166 [Trichinella zimbabwensis]|uniref:Uncharacterized protein n=1 Tax=Trichinella zimbabwensis TaxID=268475 RepID=A0A0V1H5Q3_9BILA|nr:hypothetical protein T11_2166 [Trichinella zimbabwensis]
MVMIGVKAQFAPPCFNAFTISTGLLNTKINNRNATIQQAINGQFKMKLSSHIVEMKLLTVCGEWALQCFRCEDGRTPIKQISSLFLLMNLVDEKMPIQFLKLFDDKFEMNISIVFGIDCITLHSCK